MLDDALGNFFWRQSQLLIKEGVASMFNKRFRNAHIDDLDMVITLRHQKVVEDRAKTTKDRVLFDGDDARVGLQQAAKQFRVERFYEDRI